MSERELHGDRVTLRRAQPSDIDEMVAIRQTPEVRSRWRGTNLREEFLEDVHSTDTHLFAIIADGEIVGGIQWSEETDPDYRHATIDIYVHPHMHGQGIGPDAVRTLVNDLFTRHSHHRLSIDPAADNLPAIRCYTKVGFRPVGTLRRYERGEDGQWHDALLMDMLADDRQMP